MQSMPEPLADSRPTQLFRQAEQHPALEAWIEFGGEPLLPQVEILKHKNKSKVYRLRGKRAGQPHVIAKWCRSYTARLEQVIYEEVLAEMKMPALRCYGSLPQGDGEFRWLFLEDASGRDYSPPLAEDRALAARWLACLHMQAIAAELGRTGRLPNRDLEHYLDLLRGSRRLLREHRENPFLHSEDLSMFQSIIDQCDCLESHWKELSEDPELAPKALQHGDLVIKNVRVRECANGPALLVFDWENAGWGIPAIDLAQIGDRAVTPDLNVYLESTGRGMRISSLGRIAECGRVFRLLDSICWAASMLVYQPYDWLSTPVSYLKVYQSRMAEALSAFDWD